VVEAGLSQWVRSTDHLLLWNVSIVSSAWNVLDETGGPTFVPITISNLDVRDSTFQKLTWSSVNPPPAFVGDDNHFVTGSTYGTNATVGNPLFVDPANDDFRPGPGSPLAGRVANPLTPADAANVPRVAPSSVGGLEP
jgi:hypothetical protein